MALLHNCNERTIRRKLHNADITFKPLYPKESVVILDTTYFGRNFGVMLLQDAGSGIILFRKYVRYETNAAYLECISSMVQGGSTITAVVCDGHTGLLKALGDIPVQMCQFHQIQTIRRLLTSNPRLIAGRELLALCRRMGGMEKEAFTRELEEWCKRWESFLTERTILISGRTTYTHRRLRSAKHSLIAHLPWLFTHREHPNLNIPNTTNKIEGLNSKLKRFLKDHSGMEEMNRRKFIDAFLNEENSKIITAYQMSNREILL